MAERQGHAHQARSWSAWATVRWAGWLTGVVATALWGWGILALSLDEGFTPPVMALLPLLGLATVALVVSVRRSLVGAVLLLLAGVGIGVVTVAGALTSPLEASRPVLLVVALLFPVQWLGPGAILLMDARQGRPAESDRIPSSMQS